MTRPQIHIVGAGLAGSEAAFFLAERGHSVILHEMRPKRMTEAHQTGRYAELVCSNSLKSQNPHSAPGMLKAEMNALGSLILKTAYACSVPGGEALSVDRVAFAEQVTCTLQNHPRIQWLSDEVVRPFADGLTLFSTGPLTSSMLTDWILNATGQESLYFYDAIAPIVDATSIDFDQVFLANRYDKGDEPAYLNCPLNPQEYEHFIDELLAGEVVPPQRFEKEKLFQGCQPIEAIAASGRESLRFGPMKPVGLEDPKTGKIPYAVVQLRPENPSRTAYNLVGFQTKLRYPEQSRIFRMIPALKNASFLRLGSIHRNTFLCGPEVLRPDLSLRGFPSVYFAGQITGVEGYLESAACGLLAALFIDQKCRQQTHQAPPAHTALGALLRHIIAGNGKKYEPSNMHFGLFEPTFFKQVLGLPRDEMRIEMAKQAFEGWTHWVNTYVQEGQGKRR